MQPARLLCLACLLIVSSSGLQAGLTYVDATDGPAGNTTLSNGSLLDATDGTGGTTWRQRNDAAFGSHETVFEGVDPSPEIRTTLTGLTPGQTYRVFAHFWDPQSTAENWNVRAGFVSGGLTVFSREGNSAVSGSTAGVLASTLGYDVPPTTFGPHSSRDMIAGGIGIATADPSGEIAVFIDDLGSANVNLRTWYDGVSYEPVAMPNPITYVDADIANTVRWDGEPFVPASQGDPTIDNNWKTRTLGNNGNVFESNADGPEDAPLLVTTLTGLQPETEYVLYAYFWHDGRNWRLKASADPDAIRDNGTPTNPSDDFLPTNARYNYSSTNNAVRTATVAPAAVAADFAVAPLLAEGNRTLRQAPLGTATSNADGKLAIFIDDLAGAGEANRVWYDGVGYKRALPLDPSGDEDGDGLTNARELTLGTDPYHPDTDGDGFSDGTEYILGGLPLNGANNPKIHSLLADSSADADSDKELIMTIAVPQGTPAFTAGSPTSTASFEGYLITVRGSTDLASFPVVVTPVDPIVTGLPPAPVQGGITYEYRSFSLNGSNGLPGKGFLQVTVTHP